MARELMFLIFALGILWLIFSEFSEGRGYITKFVKQVMG